ncbi:MAG: TetR/AcrR family transcriptional regulator [Clostridiales bacterium]
MDKIKEKKAHTEGQLLEAAFALFVEKGTEQTTIDQIVKRAGLAKGTFYLYFQDKQHLLQRLVQVYADALLEEAWAECFPSSGDWDILSLLTRFADWLIDAFARDSRLIRFIHRDLSFQLFSSITTKPMKEIPPHLLANISAPISQAISEDIPAKALDKIIFLLEKSGIVMKNPKIALFMIIELIVGTCYQAIIYGEPLDIQELKPHLFGAIDGLVRCL